MWTISRLFLICVGLTWVYSKEESISDLYSLLSDPDVLKLVEKRLKILDDEELVPDVGCYDLKGALIGNCGFETNKSTIIKTTQSIARGAKFIEEVSNVSCPRECTSLCCEKPDCDTAIYQDKEGHNCYLFQCGTGDVCEFAPHDSYWTSSISIIEKEVVLPGGSHENDLANVGTIGAPDVKPSVKPQTEPTTTVAPEVPTTPKPGLGEKCESYETQCEDQHAECLMRSCRCRVGYHEKNGICRKHCQDEEFECENIVYGSDSRQCVLNRYVCDGHPDCIDGSDELNCQDKTKYDGRPGNDRIPADGTNSPETHGRKPGLHGDSPAQPPPSTQKAAPTTTVAVKAQPTVAPSPTPAPVKPDDSAENHPDTDSPPLDTDQTLSNPDKHTEQASSDTDPSSSSSSSDTTDLSKSTDEDSPSVSSSEEKSASNTNTNVNKADSDSESDSDNKSNDIGDQNDEYTESDNPQGNKPELHILNAIDGESVESLIDSSQGPIIALALGLTVTILMLIIVGCRLRTVKRRLRKGRALHSNEADYLINGMYL